MSRDQWTDILNRAPHATILQSWYYAQAMREAKQQSVRHGIIMIDGQEAGAVQMQEVSLFKKAIHGFSIDRGPLWFDGYGNADHINAFAEALDRHFPARLGRKRRFMPEYFGKNHLISLRKWQKDKKINEYKTFFIDIRPKLADTRSNLKQKWRNILNKSEKSGITSAIDANLSTFSTFLNRYVKDRIEKRYAGISPRFLASLTKYAAMSDSCFILNATEDNETIAAIIIFIHGKGATYQAGWTTPYGRDKGAHHFLLWNAIALLKERGVTTFDLGGYNDDTDGIKRFKEGLGGHPIALIGSYH